MRVITGTAKGRKLFSLEGDATRPTSEIVKESIFNIIQFDIEGRLVLDLFAGTGQLGIEALSRGAKQAVFVDSSAKAIKVISQNLESTKLTDQAMAVVSDYARYLESCRIKFDLIFIDPPYGSDFAEKALTLISSFDILSCGGIIVCETDALRELPELPQPYHIGRQYRYGRKKVTLAGRNED